MSLEKGVLGMTPFPAFSLFFPCSPTPKLAGHTKASLRLVVPRVF